jgi:hypothetical protein
LIYIKSPFSTKIDFGKTLQVLTKLGEEIYIELSGKTNGVNRK